MFKDKKILFAIILLLLTIILVVSFFYFKNKNINLDKAEGNNINNFLVNRDEGRYYIDNKFIVYKNKEGLVSQRKELSPKERFLSGGDMLQETILKNSGDVHYFFGAKKLLAYNSTENKVYILPNSIVDKNYILVNLIVSPNSENVALFLTSDYDNRYLGPGDVFNKVVVLSSDLEKIVYEKAFGHDETFILAMNTSDPISNLSMSQDTRWLDNNTLKIALYDGNIPFQREYYDCEGCSAEEYKQFEKDVSTTIQNYNDTIANREPVRFVDLKIK